MHPTEPMPAPIEALAWLSGRWIGSGAEDRIEKDEAVTLDLVSLENDEAVFLKRGEQRWMVYRLEAGGGQLACWFETESSPRVAGDEFRYSRA